MFGTFSPILVATGNVIRRLTETGSIEENVHKMTTINCTLSLHKMGKIRLLFHALGVVFFCGAASKKIRPLEQDTVNILRSNGIRQMMVHIS